VQHDLHKVLPGVLGEVEPERLQELLLRWRGLSTVTSCGAKTVSVAPRHAGHQDRRGERE
jgi:hypothetical protein